MGSSDRNILVLVKVNKKKKNQTHYYNYLVLHYTITHLLSKMQNLVTLNIFDSDLAESNVTLMYNYNVAAIHELTEEINSQYYCDSVDSMASTVQSSDKEFLQSQNVLSKQETILSMKRSDCPQHRMSYHGPRYNYISSSASLDYYSHTEAYRHHSVDDLSDIEYSVCDSTSAISMERAKKYRQRDIDPKFISDSSSESAHTSLNLSDSGSENAE